ncbi:hypothetical protein FACS189411_04350 [Bacteroidia bacterium]|nr:hypothetical protein FACS189411_04350 [Bacteroidia bacterium]
MVSAFASEDSLCLGQIATEDKSNEITAIPKLLSMLDLQGDIVTIDAMGCQRKIASTIISRGADYILAVKGNQGALEEDIDYTIRLAKPRTWIVGMTGLKQENALSLPTFVISHSSKTGKTYLPLF